MPHKKLVGRTRALTVANVFGTLGYISIIFQWLWALLILCYPLIMSDHSILMPNGHVQAPQSSAATVSPIALIFAVGTTLIVMVVTVIMLIRLPKKIGQQGARITHHTANVLIPVITKKKSLPKKKRAKLSYRIILASKATLITLPLLALFYAPIGVPLESAVIWALGIFCASWSIAYVGLQQLIALAAKSPCDKLW